MSISLVSFYTGVSALSSDSVLVHTNMVLEKRGNTSAIGTFDLHCGSKRPVQDVEGL